MSNYIEVSSIMTTLLSFLQKIAILLIKPKYHTCIINRLIYINENMTYMCWYRVSCETIMGYNLSSKKGWKCLCTVCSNIYTRRFEETSFDNWMVQTYLPSYRRYNDCLFPCFWEDTFNSGFIKWSVQTSESVTIVHIPIFLSRWYAHIPTRLV